MDDGMRPNTFPGVYRVSRGWRVLFAAVGLISLGLAAMFFWFVFFGGPEKASAGMILLAAVGAAFLAIPLYLFLYVRRFSIRVDGESIAVTHVFREKTIGVSDISGYRLISSGYVPTVLFFSGDPPVRALSVELAVERRSDLMDWVGSRFVDLDRKANAEDMASILKDDNLGITEADKLSYFKNMRGIARAVNGFSVLLGLIGLFRPQPYRLVVACLAVFPFLALASVRLSRGLIRFDVRQNDIHPSIMTGFLVPSGVLMLRALFDFNILAWDAFWLPFVFLTTLVFLAYILVHKGIKLARASVVASALFFAMYGYGAALTLNTLRETAPPVVYEARVMGKRVSTGKSTSYYLEVSPWGPRGRPNEIEVGSRRYGLHDIGDDVEIRVFRGLFGIRWFDVF